MIEIILTILFVLSTIISLVSIFFIIRSNLDFEVNEANIWIDDLPQGFDKFRICHLSDIHNKIWGQKLLSRIKNIKPDLVVITGDLMESKKNFEGMMDHIGDINEIARVYYVTGNHEVWCKMDKKIIKAFKDRGIMVMDNDSTILKRDGDEIMVLGLADPDNYGYYLNEERTNNIFDNKLPLIIKDFEGIKILLSHRPNFLDIYEKYKIDLILSGHTHGGQFQIPFYGSIYAPNQGLFPEYSVGYYRKNNSQMIISKGMHSTFKSFRVNCPKEMVVVNLLGK